MRVSWAPREWIKWKKTHRPALAGEHRGARDAALGHGRGGGADRAGGKEALEESHGEARVLYQCRGVDGTLYYDGVGVVGEGEEARGWLR